MCIRDSVARLDEQLHRALAVGGDARAVGVHHAQVAASLEVAGDALAVETPRELDRIEPAVADRGVLDQRLARLVAAADQRDRDHREPGIHNVRWYHRSLAAV